MQKSTWQTFSMLFVNTIQLKTTKEDETSTYQKLRSFFHR